MSLNDTAIKNAKANTDKPYKITDEKGMYLVINQNGSKYFRLDYPLEGKRKTLALGVYPETSLKQSRDKRDTAKNQIADGINPNANKKAVKQAKATSAANSFEVIAREWFEQKMLDKSEDHKKRTLQNLNRDVYPYLGSRPIIDIEAPELLAVLKKIENRGAVETPHRVLQMCSQIFRYAIVTGRLKRDISPDLRGALKTTKGGHLRNYKTAKNSVLCRPSHTK